jgi:tripeptide aminopeptidase
MADIFRSLVEIDSVSREEGALSDVIKAHLEDLGALVVIDDSADKTGSNTGNLIAKFEGNVNVPALLLNAHMDTVEPGRGVQAELKKGVFKSSGDTILGADDKSAIAILIEVMRTLQENRLPHGPIEIVLTVCEEIGLLGAKNLDYTLISSKFGFSLDAGDPGTIVTCAPVANKIKFDLHGKDAHAGSEPERGINAISLASKAIACQDLGRIDSETTCNIGLIQGGIATNIVPSHVSVKGEVRSHDEEKLEEVTASIVASFDKIVSTYKPVTGDTRLPRMEYLVEQEFPKLNIADDHDIVRLAQEAARNLSRPLVPHKSGGGSDANIFYSKGICTPVLGTGMQDVHTTRESIRIEDMICTAELVLAIIGVNAGR